MGLVLLITLSNTLGPTDRVCRCPLGLRDSDCEGSCGSLGNDTGVVGDEPRPREPDESTVVVELDDRK